MARQILVLTNDISPEKMEILKNAGEDITFDQVIEIVGEENVEIHSSHRGIDRDILAAEAKFSKQIVNIYADVSRDMGEKMIEHIENRSMFKQQKRQNFRSPKFNF